MVTLPYRGAVQVNPNDLVDQNYLSGLGSGNISTATVNSLITAGFSGYVTTAVVDAAAAGNATQAYVDGTDGANPNGGDAGRLHISQIDPVYPSAILTAGDGVAGLDTTGRVSSARVQSASTQRFPDPFTGPAGYNTSDVSISSDTVTLYPPVVVLDPGFSYKLLVFGTVDIYLGTANVYPIITVNQGSTIGPVVGVGPGPQDLYLGGSLTQITTEGDYTFTIPAGTVQVDIVLVGGGGGGGSGAAGFVNGISGQPGYWSSQSVVLGTDVPVGTYLITGTIAGGGAGGAGGFPTTEYGSVGGTTTATLGAGSQTVNVNAGGGPGGQGFWNNTAPVSPSPYGFDNFVYNAGACGQSGGAGSGTLFLGNAGGNGQPGGAWFMCTPLPNYPPHGPAPITPWPLNDQAILSGSTTLYVQMTNNGQTIEATASDLLPSLWVMPIPA